jgi:hypothetical protein
MSTNATMRGLGLTTVTGVALSLALAPSVGALLERRPPYTPGTEG